MVSLAIHVPISIPCSVSYRLSRVTINRKLVPCLYYFEIIVMLLEKAYNIFIILLRLCRISRGSGSSSGSQGPRSHGGTKSRLSTAGEGVNKHLYGDIVLPEKGHIE